MSPTIIIDYGFCNLDSVCRAVQECGGNALVSDRPEDAAQAARLILPGVGNFSEAMHAIRAAGWDEAIRTEVSQGVPILGICLGMQLLAESGTEGEVVDGLGLIPGRVVRLERSSEELRIPHIGWNEVHLVKESELFQGITSGKDFYFVHSYHFEVDVEKHRIAETPYGDNFVSAVGNEHIVGTQFHPEKSLRIGFQVLRNFLEHY